MSAARASGAHPVAPECPKPEEFSALLDWELAGERLPRLEKHIEDCASCRKHYLRMSAADRMLWLVLGQVNVVQECLEVKADEKDVPSAELVAALEAAGREERLAALREIARRQAARRKRRIIITAVAAVLLVGGFFGVLEPTPVSALAGGAAREDSYIVAKDSAGEVTLVRGVKVKLAPNSTARFWCAFRWDQPQAELVRGQLAVVEGKLSVTIGGQKKELATGETTPVRQ